METTMSERQYEIMAELGELLKQQQELFEALPKAIAIAQVWPDAFYKGLGCTPHFVGTKYTNGIVSKVYPAPYDRFRTITRTYLKRADGVEYDITAEDFFSIMNA